MRRIAGEGAMQQPSRLEAEELADLVGQFRLSIGSPPAAVHALRSAELLDDAACAAYLDGLTVLLGSPSRMITASQFAKRYAFLSIVPALYAMSAWDKGLELPLDGVALEQPAAAGSGRWSPVLRIAEPRVTAPAPGWREEWRREQVGALFAGHLAPIWRAVAAVSSVSKAMLWENAAVRLFSLYEKRLEGAGEPQTRARIREDFRYLVNEAPGSLFGEKTNPLQRFYGSASPHRLPESPRIRKTCCLYYLVAAEGSYCDACPKEKPAR